MRRVRLRMLEADDAGFSLVEMVVALLIAGMVFGALATTLVASVRASLLSRQNQQATDYMTQAVEELRLLSYGSLSESAAALSSDPRVHTCSSGLCLTVNGTDEVLVTADPWGVDAATTLQDAATNGTTYTINRYVTAAPTIGTDLARRVSVYISWNLNGITHTRSTSSMIAYSQQGLPLPFFDLTPATDTASFNPGAWAWHAFTLANKGAPDRWNLTLTGDTTGFELYADSVGDGVFNPAVDTTQLTDTTSDGIPDTGRVDPGTSFRFFLVLPPTSPQPLGTMTTTVTATSVGQPTATGATKHAVATTVFVSGAVGPTPVPTSTTPAPTPTSTDVTCSAASLPTASSTNSYTLTTYALHNAGTLDSTTLPQLTMTSTAATWPALGEYSTDRSTSSGRLVDPTAVTAASDVLALMDPTTYADWEIQYPSAVSIEGVTTTTLWFAGASGTAPGVTVRALLYTVSADGTTKTIQASGSTAAPAGCAGFQQVGVALSSMNGSSGVPKNGKLHLRVVVNGAQVRFGYDATPMAAGFTVGVK